MLILSGVSCVIARAEQTPKRLQVLQRDCLARSRSPTVVAVALDHRSSPTRRSPTCSVSVPIE